MARARSTVSMWRATISQRSTDPRVRPVALRPHMRSGSTSGSRNPSCTLPTGPTVDSRSTISRDHGSALSDRTFSSCQAGSLSSATILLLRNRMLALRSLTPRTNSCARSARTRPLLTSWVAQRLRRRWRSGAHRGSAPGVLQQPTRHHDRSCGEHLRDRVAHRRPVHQASSTLNTTSCLSVVLTTITMVGLRYWVKANNRLVSLPS